VTGEATAVTDHTEFIDLSPKVTAGLTKRKPLPIVNVPFEDGVWRHRNGVVFHKVLDRDDDGVAIDETFFAECVAAVHSTEVIARQVVGGRKERTVDSEGKRSETPMESMRQTLKTRGAQESALMFKQGWNGIGSVLWWMTGTMFLYLRSQFMVDHVDNPKDEHAKFGEEEFKSDQNYKTNCHCQAMSRLLLKSSQPGRASMLL